MWEWTGFVTKKRGIKIEHRFGINWFFLVLICMLLIDWSINNEFAWFNKSKNIQRVFQLFFFCWWARSSARWQSVRILLDNHYECVLMRFLSRTKLLARQTTNNWLFRSAKKVYVKTGTERKTNKLQRCNDQLALNI